MRVTLVLWASRMSHAHVLSSYHKFSFDDGRYKRDVYKKGEGPAVIVIHEMPGPHPLVVRFADRVAKAGMTVFLPHLFGEVGRPVSLGYVLKTITKTICVAREFNVWANDKSSPIVDWLRALSKSVHTDCGGRGVGAVGMCFTGGFALAMMTEPSMVAPVLSQPSSPLFGRHKKSRTDASPSEIQCAKERMENEDLRMIGLRFKGDAFVPDERFDLYKREFGDRFEAIELDPKDAAPTPKGPHRPHSVLTIHLKDEEGEPTKNAEKRVIQFLKDQTRE